MALATRCPNCHSMFRVVADQLKLRGGLVRCGHCRNVFDAIGSLSYIDDQAIVGPAGERIEVTPTVIGPTDEPVDEPAAPAPEPPMPPARRLPASLAEDWQPTRPASAVPPVSPSPVPPSPVSPSPVPPSPTPAQGPPAMPPPPPPPPAPLPAAPLPVPAPAAAPHADPAAIPQAPGLAARAPVRRPSSPVAPAAATAAPLSPAPAPGPGEPFGAHFDPVFAAPEELDTRDPAAQTIAVPEERIGLADPEAQPGLDAPDDAQPAFLRTERRPRFSIVFGGGSALLGLMLAIQSAVIFRHELVSAWPSARPALLSICELFGCTVGWPSRAELLAVVGSELRNLPGTEVLELTAVVRNRANHTVALPAIEVTLTDTQARPIARKVFAPVDYLAAAGEPSKRIEEGLGAGVDYTVRIVFEARGLSATGFVVYPFYL